MTDRLRLKHIVNMGIAESVSNLSTCKFTHVGAVIVDPINNRIVATGYNGSIPGGVHCTDIIWDNSESGRNQHKEWSDKNEIHAEMNAILNAAKNGAKTENCVLYTTVSPCWNCLKHIRTAGISNIFYKSKYWRLDESEIVDQENVFNCVIEKV